MNFLSKDASLEESITRMKEVLASVGCETTLSQEKHPLDHCYSVNLASVEVPNHIYSNGKGVVSDASIASAFGEYIERLQTNNSFSDFYLGNRKQYPDEIVFEFGGGYLNDELRILYDPDGELQEQDLVDYNSDFEDKIVALPFTKQSDGDTVYFPLGILSNLYVSNGLATGNTPEEAHVQALSEILERYAKMEIIKKGYALPKIPDGIVQSFERVQSGVEELRRRGYIVEVLDASLGGKYPVTAISLIHPKSSSLFVSFGAHPILEVSLERTMTELVQGRELDELDTFDVPTFDMDFVASSFNLEAHFISSNGKIGFGFLRSAKTFEYTPWDYTGNGSVEEYNYLSNIIEMMGRDIYLRQYNYLGFYSCQMIVPGVSEIYPMEDLIYNNKNGGKLIRNMVLDFGEYTPQEILDSIQSLDESINMEKYIGVIFETNFTMLEFKAQMHLLLGEKREAMLHLESADGKLGHIVAELIRMEEEQLAFAEHKQALFDIFGQERVEKALRIVEGKASLIDTSLHIDYHNMLGLYDRLARKKQGTLFSQ